MPQMAPLYWLYLFIFFLFIFLLFLMLNFFIKPYNNMISTSSSLFNKTTCKFWKL